MLKQKDTVQNMLLQMGPNSSAFKESEVKNTLKHFTKEFKHMKTFETDMNKMKVSFTAQIENLQETLSSSLLQTIEISEKKDKDIADLVKMIEKSRAKHHEDKKQIKWLRKKLDKLEKEYDKLVSNHNKLLQSKTAMDTKYFTLEKTHEKDLDLIKDLNKKLYKMEVEDDLINLNPYDLHMKIRYYETQMDQKDKE
mmetsp:Transcript_38346/g.37859  ORF Transcript_38346/g.37859 Transcript_38346/m.37859 type:complete len:196 (+) Transcript_38346:273-860(+)